MVLCISWRRWKQIDLFATGIWYHEMSDWLVSATLNLALSECQLDIVPFFRGCLLSSLSAVHSLLPPSVIEYEDYLLASDRSAVDNSVFGQRTVLWLDAPLIYRLMMFGCLTFVWRGDPAIAPAKQAQQQKQKLGNAQQQQLQQPRPTSPGSAFNQVLPPSPQDERFANQKHQSAVTMAADGNKEPRIQTPSKGADERAIDVGFTPQNQTDVPNTARSCGAPSTLHADSRPEVQSTSSENVGS